MQETIKARLTELERQYSVKILFACETGSRAWGFPSPDSDYDVRIIYKHDLDWYLSLADRDDTIEYMSKNGELDITGWDIKKCLQLMWKSNGALLERVQSPIVYSEEAGMAEAMKSYAFRCFSPIATMHHYLGMAKKSFAEVERRSETKLKRLFYALRAALACKWITDKGTPPPIVFMAMVNELHFDARLKARIIELIDLKSGKSERYLHPAEHDLNDFITAEIMAADKVFNTLPGRKEKEVELDNFFAEVVKAR